MLCSLTFVDIPYEIIFKADDFSQGHTVGTTQSEFYFGIDDLHEFIAGSYLHEFIAGSFNGMTLRKKLISGEMEYSRKRPLICRENISGPGFYFFSDCF